jgi:hypothetical protein
MNRLISDAEQADRDALVARGVPAATARILAEQFARLTEQDAA